MFLTSKELDHADGNFRIIPKHREPLEDIMTASFRTEIYFKTTL